MRFTVRAGTDPIARADAVLLRTLGLPSGGVVRIGETHVVVQPGDVANPTDLSLGTLSAENAGVATGQTVDVVRAMLSQAQWVTLREVPLDSRTLVRALQGRAVTSGDRLRVLGDYLDGTDVDLEVVSVEPDGAAIIGAPTRFVTDGELAGSVPAPPTAARTVPPLREGPTQAEALLAGLDNELDMLTGWFSLLAGPDDLAQAWGLPRVAGVLIEGPNGCGKSELVRAAADRAGTPVHEVDTTLVFKPERLLDLLSEAVSSSDGARVIFVDRLETVTGNESMSTFRTQIVAILRWFLDTVSTKPRVACVLGVRSIGDLDPSISSSGLLPRSLSIPPPDLGRRRLLFQAALLRVPCEDIDFDRLAALSAGFSGADVLAAVVHASSVLARTGGELTTDVAVEAVEATTPSLGSVPLGQMTGFGFDKVANLDEVKRRLTEAVIWPMQDPERFVKLGIDPPKGILLYGPPGTGKTYVVKALAHEAGAAFFSVKGAELLDKFVGESERGVRDVFARARGASPSIIFFDEFDALAPTRGRSTNSVSDSVVAALLTEIDGVASRGTIAVIAATNRADLIDPALLRAGRFETHILLDLPERSARLAMLEMSDVPLADEVDVGVLADRTEGLSFADITGVLREAALATLREGTEAESVGWTHLDLALGRFVAR